MTAARTISSPGPGRLAGILIAAMAVAPAVAQNQPVRISDAAGSSLALRMEWQSAANADDWPGGPGPRSLVPLYDAWEIGIASLHGEAPQQLATGQRIAYREGRVDGPATVRSETVLTLAHVAKKWAGGFDGGEVSGFVGLGAARLAMLVDAGSAGQFDFARSAPGMVLGLGFKHDLTVRSTFEARLGLFSGNPLYLIGKHDFAGGLTNEAVFGEVGVIWPRHQTVALHVGVQAIRYVPQQKSVGMTDESLTELRLWGPFLGIQAALR